MYRTGFGKLGDWTNHNIEEIISGYYDIPHGAGLSTITPQWMRYVYKNHLPMFVQFAVNDCRNGGIHSALPRRRRKALGTDRRSMK